MSQHRGTSNPETSVLAWGIAGQSQHLAQWKRGTRRSNRRKKTRDIFPDLLRPVPWQIACFTARSKPPRSQSVHPTGFGSRSHAKGLQSTWHDNDSYVSCSKPRTARDNWRQSGLINHLSLCYYSAVFDHVSVYTWTVWVVYACVVGFFWCLQLYFRYKYSVDMTGSDMGWKRVEQELGLNFGSPAVLLNMSAHCPLGHREKSLLHFKNSRREEVSLLGPGHLSLNIYSLSQF